MDSFYAARGALEHSNYMADTLASARLQHGMPSSDQQQQARSLFSLQELEDLQ
jgi:hypothetical protein